MRGIFLACGPGRFNGFYFFFQLIIFKSNLLFRRRTPSIIKLYLIFTVTQMHKKTTVIM